MLELATTIKHSTKDPKERMIKLMGESFGSIIRAHATMGEREITKRIGEMDGVEISTKVWEIVCGVSMSIAQSQIVDDG